MRSKWIVATAIGVLLGGVAVHYYDAYKARTVIGRVENVSLQDVKMKMKARIDTGAGLTSVHAEILEILPPESKDKPEWVRFKLTDIYGHSKVIEHEIVDWVEIKNKGKHGGFTRRPVVVMDFCLGGKQVEARVNLADRSAFLYPLLIGRNVLKAGDYLIDPEVTFTHWPGCTYRRPPRATRSKKD